MAIAKHRCVQATISVLIWLYISGNYLQEIHSNQVLGWRLLLLQYIQDAINFYRSSSCEKSPKALMIYNHIAKYINDQLNLTGCTSECF